MVSALLPPLTLVGGVASSPTLAASLASILQREVRVAHAPSHVPALGAAALAAAALASVDAANGSGDRAAGAAHADGEACAAVHKPNPNLRAVYDDAYRRFCMLHPSLRDTFAAAQQQLET